MAILVITGELGSGKTLSLTYLAWRNWYYKGAIIYANYTLYGIPYYKITRVSELDKIRSGYLCADEMWVWLEASVGEMLKRKIISDILRKSRKRDLTIASTSQTMDQIPPRIRKIVDLIGYPILNRTQTICKLLIFAGPKASTLVKTHYFFTKPVFEMYNTKEEIGDLIDDVSGTWKKAISPTTQLKYQKEFIRLQQPIQIQNPKKVEIKNIFSPLKTISLPRLDLTPNIDINTDLTLEDAENEKLWKDEEKAIKEEIKKVVEESA